MVREMVLIGLLLGPTLALAAPQFREDLAKASSYFCDESTASLQDLGIYDVQLELAFTEAVKDPKAFAESFALENKHRGFAYGHCKDQRKWIISSPSPDAVLQLIEAKKILKIDTEALTSICASYDVDGIQKGIEAPVSLAKGLKPGAKPTEIPFQKELFATVTLTCHPKDKAKEGDELWALFQLSPPETLRDLADEKDFRSWINELRRRNNLAPLDKGDKSLQDLADESAAVKNLRHPRELLLQKKGELKKAKIDLLGENRASAKTFRGLAELFWNSPTHRRLLLNPRANQIALKTTDKGDEKLLVMVLARK